MNTFLLVSSLLFGFLGIIWNRNTHANLGLKIILIGMALWGGFFVLETSGYIVQL